MMNLESLKKVRDGMKADTAKAQAKLTTLDAAVADVKDDAGLRPQFKNDKIAELRATALPEIAEAVRTFDERLARVVAQRQFWASKPLLLSRIKFDADPAADAAIKLQRGDEYTRMDAATLQITADNAVADGDLPTLWATYIAGQQRSGAGWRGIALDDVTVPNQDDALTLIKQCENLAWLAHSIFSQASGNVLTGIDKLSAARALAATQPGRPTSHNSPGRPSA